MAKPDTAVPGPPAIDDREGPGYLFSQGKRKRPAGTGPYTSGNPNRN